MTPGDHASWTGIRRYFLGWDRPLFHEALAHLSQYQSSQANQSQAYHRIPQVWDLSDHLIVTNSSTSGRKFQMRLSEFAQSSVPADPPRILMPLATCTTGEVAEKLYSSRHLKHPKVDLSVRGVNHQTSLALRRAFIANQGQEQLGRYGMDAPGMDEESGRLRELHLWFKTVNELRAHRYPVDERLIEKIEAVCQGEFMLSPRSLEQWQQLINLENDYQQWLIQTALESQMGFLPLDLNLARELALQPSNAQSSHNDLANAPCHVVLLGVLELPPLARALIRRHSEQGGQVSCLIQAPAEHTQRFDELGVLQPKQWFPPTRAGIEKRHQNLPPISCDLTDEQIHVCDSTIQMGQHALHILSQQQMVDEIADSKEERAPFPTDRIALFVPDESRNTSLSGAFAAHDLTLTSASGKPLSQSAPIRLLNALNQFISDQTYSQLCTLLRLPHLLQFFETRINEKRYRRKNIHLLSVLDEYGERFLPHDLAQLKHDLKRRMVQEDRRLHQQMHHLLSQIDQWLLEGMQSQSRQKTFSDRRRHSLPDWLNWLTHVLRSLFIAPFNKSTAISEVTERDKNVDTKALQLIDTHLNSLRDMPLTSELTFTCSQFLSFFAHGLSHERIPESHQPGEIEVSGWLEIYLNDSPCKMILGATLDSLPASVNSGGRWLTATLREKLGLETDEKRLARDLCILKTVNQLSQSARTWSGYKQMPPALSVIVPRHADDGQPLAPSPLLFAEEKTITARRLRALCIESMGQPIPDVHLNLIDRKENEAKISALTRPPITIPEPVRDQQKKPIKLSVTALKIYLNDPYQYYLEKVLKLKSVGDAELELDALAFGNLAHDALNQFALTDDVNSLNPDTIEKNLTYQIRELAEQRYGSQPTIAIQLQVEQLLYRMKPYAHWHAAQRRAGWRISPDLVEWTVKWPFQHNGHDFLFEGRLDRVDYHESLGYRVIDFKTTESGPKPRLDHVSGKGENLKWKSLQLPVYRRLMVEGGKLREAELDQKLETGYFIISSDLKKNTFAAADFCSSELDSAWRAFEDALDNIAAQHFLPNPDRKTYGDTSAFDHFEAIRLAYAADSQLLLDRLINRESKVDGAEGSDS